MSLLEKPVSEKRYLCYQEVRLLYGIGRDAIRTLVRSRQLRRSKVGTAWRYPVSDLERIFSSDTRISRRIAKAI